METQGLDAAVQFLETVLIKNENPSGYLFSSQKLTTLTRNDILKIEKSKLKESPNSQSISLSKTTKSLPFAMINSSEFQRRLEAVQGLGIELPKTDQSLVTGPSQLNEGVPQPKEVEIIEQTATTSIIKEPEEIEPTEKTETTVTLKPKKKKFLNRLFSRYTFSRYKNQGSNQESTNVTKTEVAQMIEIKNSQVDLGAPKREPKQSQLKFGKLIIQTLLVGGCNFVWVTVSNRVNKTAFVTLLRALPYDNWVGYALPIDYTTMRNGFSGAGLVAITATFLKCVSPAIPAIVHNFPIVKPFFDTLEVINTNAIEPNPLLFFTSTSIIGGV